MQEFYKRDMSFLSTRNFPKLFVWTICILPLLGNLGVSFLMDTSLTWSFSFLIIIMIVYYRRRIGKNIISRDYPIASIFIVIASIGVLRGIFIAENYWEYKQLVLGTLCLCLPLSVYIFGNSEILRQTFYLWNRLYIPLFVLFGIWGITVSAWHFFISPIFILGCFLPIIKSRKWKMCFLIFLVVMLVGDIGARAQIMKSFAVILIAIGVFFRRFVPQLLLSVLWTVFLVIPILLLVLGITGTFNIFADNSEKNEGKYTQTMYVDGQKKEVDASDDTRTFIYQEVISSAINHHYVLFGRSPARGNDSAAFGAFNAEELKTGKYERYMNEVCHPNVFTWLGIVGLIPWCLMYMSASWLAVFRSRNIFMRFVGVFVAFRFLLGWIEDMNNFNISGISVWILISMCYSQQFRNMENEDFKAWVNGCLSFNRKRLIR